MFYVLGFILTLLFTILSNIFSGNVENGRRDAKKIFDELKYK